MLFGVKRLHNWVNYTNITREEWTRIFDWFELMVIGEEQDIDLVQL